MNFWDYEQFRTAIGKKFDGDELINTHVTDWKKVYQHYRGNM
jgi:hypothetical protein